MLVHGNGPQVGALALAQEAVAPRGPARSPCSCSGAMTQGQLGYLLAQALGDALAAPGRRARVAAVMTQVVVDADDPAFSSPTKPIGPFFSGGPRAAAGAGARLGRGGGRRAAAGGGWSPRPDPLEVVEVAADPRPCSTPAQVVVACGGGGVPVGARRTTRLVGVEAVIDKDFAAALRRRAGRRRPRCCC